MDDFAKGESFVREKTGSATLINLDGRWEHDFVEDDTAVGEKIRIKKKEQTKPNDASGMDDQDKILQ